jgi:hypothetical protein
MEGSLLERLRACVESRIDALGERRHGGRQEEWKKHAKTQARYGPTCSDDRLHDHYGLIRFRRGSLSSVRQLQAAIGAYLAEHNKDPKPFTWAASADSIFRKLENSLS